MIWWLLKMLARYLFVVLIFWLNFFWAFFVEIEHFKYFWRDEKQLSTKPWAGYEPSFIADFKAIMRSGVGAY